MSYIYLLDIYRLIDQRIEDAQAAVGNEAADPMGKSYQQGRLQALMDFKAYLIQNLNPRLPRRIREDFERKHQLS